MAGKWVLALVSGLNSSPHGPLCRAVWVFSQHGGGLPSQGVIQEKEAEATCPLRHIFKVTYLHFCRVLLELTHSIKRRGIRLYFLKGRYQRIWRCFFKITIFNIFKNKLIKLNDMFQRYCKMSYALFYAHRLLVHTALFYSCCIFIVY